MSKVNCFSVLGISFLVLITFCNGDVNSENAKAKIDAFIKNIIKCRNIPGMNLAIVKDGEVLYTTGYGLSNLEKLTPVTENTHFSVASVSKGFASTLLGKVLSEKKLWYDEPARNVLGEEFYFNDVYRSKHATLRDMLAHKMGLPSNNYARFQDGLTRETLTKKIRFFNYTTPIRTKFMYNNLIYGVLSHATEKTGGDTWENLMTNKIFIPLQMNNSTFTHKVDISKVDYATPYFTDLSTGNKRPISMAFHSEWGKIGGSGSVFTTAGDMAKWLLFQTAEGKDPNGKQVLEKNYFDEIHKDTFTTGKSEKTRIYERPTIPVSYTFEKYALAWRTGYYRGLPMVLHTGTSWGYGALLTLIPSSKIGIFTNINGEDRGYPARRAVHMYIMDLLLGEEPWLNLTTACTFPAPWVPSQPPARPVMVDHQEYKAKRPLKEYEGMYGNFAFGNLTVFINGTNLEIRYGKMGKFVLHPTSQPDEFSGQGRDLVWSITLSSVQFFSSKGDSNIDSVRIPRFEKTAPPVFVRDLKMSQAPPPPNLNFVTKDFVTSSGPLFFMNCRFILLFYSICMIIFL